MSTHPNDPLSPEERELAQLMGRLGPTGEPSPTLDAKILAAAHAAATGKPAPVGKPRWPVAIGLAASVVFAVGIAWQLRPLQQVASVPEAAVSYPAVEAPGADDRATAVVAPKVIAAPMAQDAAAAADSMPALAPPPPPEAPAPVAQSIREQPPRDMPRPLPAREAVPSAERTEPRRSAAYAPPPPPAPPTPIAPAPAQASTPQAFAAEAGAMADAAVAKQAPTPGNARALDARQSATRNEAKAANAAAAREEESTTLDRIEVTGSRLRTDLQVPVSDDARLATEEWLERVRTRYGLGDAEAARQSLLLFIKDHPDETVPEDLEPLLDE